jgi:hypothetical protein
MGPPYTVRASEGEDGQWVVEKTEMKPCIRYVASTDTKEDANAIADALNKADGW